MAWHPKSPKCSGCSAHDVGKSFVPSRGPANAPLLLLGQGPGETEASLGSPFLGPSGERLGVWLRMAGIDQRTECRVGNVVQCWLPENREPTRGEVDHCRDAHWGVETAGRRVIVPIGVPAMKQFYPKAGESTAGQIIRWQGGGVEGHTRNGRAIEDGSSWAHPVTGGFGPAAGDKGPIQRHNESASVAGEPGLFSSALTLEAGAETSPPSTTYVVGLLHPAFILRGNWALEPLQIQTLKLVRRVLNGETPEVHDFSKPHPNANLFPTLEELREWRAGFLPGDEVAVDVEAAGNVLTMVGMCRVRDLAHVAVWFRQQGGEPWPHPDWSALVEWLYDFLADTSVGKCFHNAAYDLDQLEDVGFDVNGFSYDTLLGMHLSFPEMRKRLESVTLLCAGFTGWKALLRDGEGHNK